jgi:hypothetical protein
MCCNYRHDKYKHVYDGKRLCKNYVGVFIDNDGIDRYSNMHYCTTHHLLEIIDSLMDQYFYSKDEELTSVFTPDNKLILIDYLNHLISKVKITK